MTSLTGPSLGVLKTFIASANAQYRSAGLGEYQMRVKRDGSVTIPNRPRPKFDAPAANGTAAGEQTKAGAAQPAPSAAATPAAAPAAGAAQPPRAGAAPGVSDLKTAGADGFQLTWKPTQGATQYGIWQDGALIGHVTNPSFAGSLAVGATGTIQVDAVLADGTRTQLTRALRVARAQDGPVKFDVPGAAAAPAAATGSAAAAG